MSDIAGHEYLITGQDLKSIRKRLNLTQQEMAFELGVSRQTIISWEAKGEDYLDRIVFLAMKALVNIPETRRVGADGHLTFGEETT